LNFLNLDKSQEYSSSVIN
ncbi:unnamed protein product, partial [Rotaria sp. Silwood1]